MPLSFKAVSAGQVIDDAAVISQTLNGISLLPFAPVNLYGVRNAAGDLFIHWTYRSRIGPGLRPNIGVPLAEERKVFELEVYNGATLLDTWRVAPLDVVERPQWIIDRNPKNLGSISTDGDLHFVVIGTGVGDILFLSQQRLAADELNLLSFYTNGASPTADMPYEVGLLSEANLVDDLSGLDPDYGWRRNIAGGFIQVFDGGSTHETVPDAAYTQLTIRLNVGVVTYYQDRVDDSSLILSTAASTASGYYRVFVRQSTSFSVARKLVDVTIQHPIGIAKYSGDQQVLRFGTLQSAIKVRVRQVSAVVGRGAYVEGVI